MPRIVIDTVVFVRGLINPRSWWGRLVFEQASDYSLVLSKPIVIEIMEVLQRPRLRQRFSTLAGRELRAVLDLLARAALVELGDIPAVTRDVKDDKFLATALAGSAEYIVTEDADLLDLIEHQGVKIVTAEEFLRILTTSQHDDDVR